MPGLPRARSLQALCRRQESFIQCFSIARLTEARPWGLGDARAGFGNLESCIHTRHGTCVSDPETLCGSTSRVSRYAAPERVAGERPAPGSYRVCPDLSALHFSSRYLTSASGFLRYGAMFAGSPKSRPASPGQRLSASAASSSLRCPYRLQR